MRNYLDKWIIWISMSENTSFVPSGHTSPCMACYSAQLWGGRQLPSKLGETRSQRLITSLVTGVGIKARIPSCPTTVNPTPFNFSVTWNTPSECTVKLRIADKLNKEVLIRFSKEVSHPNCTHGTQSNASGGSCHFLQ